MMVLDKVIGHRTDGSEIGENDAYDISKGGKRRRKKTTKSHHKLFKQNDGSSRWKIFKDIKDSYPAQLATFAIKNGLDKESAFAWWIPYFTRKNKRIVQKLKIKYRSRTHTLGIRMPKTFTAEIDIDKESGNTLWWDAMMLEMKNVQCHRQV